MKKVGLSPNDMKGLIWEGFSMKIIFLFVFVSLIFQIQVMATGNGNNFSKSPDDCVTCHDSRGNFLDIPGNGFQPPDDIPEISASSSALYSALSSTTDDLKIIVTPGLQTTHMGPRSWWSYMWWPAPDYTQDAYILVMNGSGIVTGINWTGAGNDTSLGWWYRPNYNAAAQFKITPEGSSGWKYSVTQGMTGKPGTYFNTWQWSYPAFPSPSPVMADPWYNATHLVSMPHSDEFKVNLDLPGYDPVEENAPFYVTPLTCGKEGCHSDRADGGHFGSTVVCNSTAPTYVNGYCDIGGSVTEGCTLCHGNIYMTIHGGIGTRTVHPHEIDTHRQELVCTDCHIGQLHGVHNSSPLGSTEDERCIACHGDLTFPQFSGSNVTELHSIMGDYRPNWASSRENVKSFLMDKTDGDTFNLSMAWNNPSVDLDFFVFDFTGSNVGQSTSLDNPEIFSDNLPAGVYIIKAVWYKMDIPRLPDSEPPVDVVLTSNNSYGFMEKPIIDKEGPSWECGRCHPRTGSRLDYVPSWDSYRPDGPNGHADVDSDGDTDIACRFCHGPFHNVKASGCRDCHLVPQPFQHSNGTKWGSYWTGNDDDSSCKYCHTDSKHNETALGYANRGLKDPGNIVNASLNISQQWCAGCHVENYTYYYGNNMTPVPPSIEAGGDYYPANASPFDHTRAIRLDNSDSKCFACHSGEGQLRGSVTLDRFIHSLGRHKNSCSLCHTVHPVG